MKKFKIFFCYILIFSLVFTTVICVRPERAEAKAPTLTDDVTTMFALLLSCGISYTYHYIDKISDNVYDLIDPEAWKLNFYDRLGNGTYGKYWDEEMENEYKDSDEYTSNKPFLVYNNSQTPNNDDEPPEYSSWENLKRWIRAHPNAPLNLTINGALTNVIIKTVKLFLTNVNSDYEDTDNITVNNTYFDPTKVGGSPTDKLQMNSVYNANGSFVYYYDPVYDAWKLSKYSNQYSDNFNYHETKLYFNRLAYGSNIYVYGYYIEFIKHDDYLSILTYDAPKFYNTTNGAASSEKLYTITVPDNAKAFQLWHPERGQGYVYTASDRITHYLCTSGGTMYVPSNTDLQDYVADIQESIEEIPTKYPDTNPNTNPDADINEFPEVWESIDTDVKLNPLIEDTYDYNPSKVTQPDPDINPSTEIPQDISVSKFLLPDWIKTRFPFCVPWDVYNIYKSFQATPEAPHITGTIKLGKWNETIDIDLSKINFNTVLGFNMLIMFKQLQILLFVIYLAWCSWGFVKGGSN